MGLLNNTTPPPKTTWLGWLGVGCVVFSVLLTLAQVSEQDTLGSFYSSRVALFNDGHYWLKLHFLLVFMTILDVFLVPAIVVIGLRAVWRQARSAVIEAPPGWETGQPSRRATQLVVTLALAAAWLLFVFALLVDPQRMVSLRYLAFIGCALLPFAPMAVPVLAFDALLPSRYVEGVVQIHVSDEDKLAHVEVAGEELRTSIDRVRGIASGARVRVLFSGFLRRVQRIELTR